MTELIDNVKPHHTKGRGKAITLLILTSIGSFVKVAIAGIVFFVVNFERISNYMGKNDRFVYLTVLVVGGCSILNLLGSILMFRRRQVGAWIYCFGQLAGIVMFTWCVLAVNSKIGEEEQVGLLIAYGVTIIFTVLYLSNWRYFSRRAEQKDEGDF